MSGDQDKVIILKSDVNAQTLFYEEIANSSLNKEYEFIEVTTGMEALQLLMQYGSGCLLFSISNKKELQDLAIVLKKLKKEITKNLYKVSGYNNINNKKVEKFLKEHHVADIFEGEVTAKAIEFKFSLWFRSIVAARKKHQNTQQSNKSSANQKEQLSSKMKGSTKAKNPVKFLPPLELHSDCWILPKENSAKNIMNSWVIEMIGPGPAAGHWQDITKKTNSITPVWKWIPVREDLFTFILDDGYWIYKGREPFFNWESNLWKFSGNEPELLFYNDNEQTSKFFIENNQLHITETSEQAKAKMQMLKESFDPKYSLEGESITEDIDGKAKAEKINLFYKGELEDGQKEQIKTDIHKTEGYQEKQGGHLAGEGKAERKEDITKGHQRSTKLNLEKGPQEANQKTSSREQIEQESNTKKRSMEQLKNSSNDKRAGFKERQEGALQGQGAVERQDDNFTGRGNVKEEIARQIQKRTPLEREQLSEDGQALKRGKGTTAPSQAVDEDDLDRLREELENDIKKATELDLEKSVEQISKKSKREREKQKRQSTNQETLERKQREIAERQKREKEENFGSLSGVLDAPVDIGEENPNNRNSSHAHSALHSRDNQQGPGLQKGSYDNENENGPMAHGQAAKSTQQENQHGQYNESFQDEHGDFKETDKDWEKYYRGGAAKKEKEKKESGWDGPSSRKDSTEYGGAYKGALQQNDDDARAGDGPLSGKLSNPREAQERDDKRKAFDEYMNAIKPQEEREKKEYASIGNRTINTREIELSLTLKTQSKSGELFDIEDETELLDIIDNIVVVKNIDRKIYRIHCPILLHCRAYFSGHDYDFTMGGRLEEIEGEEGEILNLELAKYNPKDLENLLQLFTDRQNNITNFIYAAQGKE